MFARVRKSLVAAVTAAAAAYTSGQVVGDLDTLPEWLIVVAAAVVAGYATWQVPNAVESPAPPA